ncbi:hypothetical protein RDI58_007867 [Solanum bulbocastanum]|uniref:Uncharacterized protein n=1 Tax=Solanum bulbocastanum TaxID=147425 RepID=A0AAN8TVX9_SOLBU
MIEVLVEGFEIFPDLLKRLPEQQLLGIQVDKSVEFSYDFSISNKTEEGGFGAVKYAELRGKVTTSYLKIISSYVMQDDQFFPMLTVPVTFMFAAEVRLPPSVSRAERKTTTLSWSIKHSITDLDPSSII